MSATSGRLGDLPTRRADRRTGARCSSGSRDYLDASASGIRCCRTSQPGEIRASLPASPPATASRSTTILDDFESKIIPGITHWNHPAFFGYFATSSSVPGILAEMLTAALDVKAMLWKTSPAATELEQVVTDWLRQMLGLSDGWFGITTDTASISSMLALAAAREAQPELQIRERGMAGRTDLPRLRVYCSAHAHSSVDKAALALGIGLENVVKIADDERISHAPGRARGGDRGRSRAGYSAARVRRDGRHDEHDEHRSRCRRSPRSASASSVWLHVDGAYGGVLAIVPEYPLHPRRRRAARTRSS